LSKTVSQKNLNNKLLIPTREENETEGNQIRKNQLLAILPKRLRMRCRSLLNMVRASISFLMTRTRVVKIAFVIIALMFLSGTLSGFMLAQVTSATQTQGKLSNFGTVKTVGVGIYEDAGLTSPMTAINWGTLDPGSQKTVTVYIQN
jgi:hypothetical protein